jgi:hypothetical protein
MLRATAIALVLLTATAHAEPLWVFSGGIGRDWATFTPTGYKTLDAGLGGFLTVGVPVVTTADKLWSFELGGRVQAAYMNGQQFMNSSLSNDYEYLSFGGLAEATLVFHDQGWVSLGGGYHHARIHDSAASTKSTDDGADSYTVAAELGGTIYSGLGLYGDAIYLGDGGWVIGLGVAFRFDTGP